MACEYLKSIGYTVIDVNRGTEALQGCNEFPGAIHLLLTDVVMPEMNGRELADQIIQKRPGVKVLFTSGYTDDAIVRHGVLETGIAFIQKPYRPRALARKIREVRGHEAAFPNPKQGRHKPGGIHDQSMNKSERAKKDCRNSSFQM